MLNTAKQCRLGLFQDSDFAGDLEDSKSAAGGTSCAFWEVIHLSQSVGCGRNKLQFRTVQQNQKSFPWTQDRGWTVSPHLIFWDLIVAVLHGNTCQSNQERGDQCTNLVRAAPHKLQKRKRSQGMINVLNNIDCVPSNVNSSHQEALLYIFEDNEAVIKMIINGRSPTMRHVSRIHRVALDRLFDRINLDPKIQVKYIDTKNQLADILTMGNFTRDEWNHLLCLFNVSHFSSTDCSEVMSKGTQEESGEERVTAKSRPMMSFGARVPFEHIIFGVRKPGEEKLWKSKSSEYAS